MVARGLLLSGDVAKRKPAAGFVRALTRIDDFHSASVEKIREVAFFQGEHADVGVFSVLQLSVTRNERIRNKAAPPFAPEHLEFDNASGFQQPEELGDVALLINRLHVLEDNDRVDEIKCSGGKQLQVSRAVEVIDAFRSELIETIGVLEHRRRNVDAVNLFEVPGQGLAQAPDTAAEIERLAL